MNSPFLTMASLQLLLFIYVAAGYVLTRCNTITPAGRKSLSDLLIQFILPCNIICSFQIEMNAQILASCAMIVLLSAFVQVFYLISSKLLFSRAPRRQLACMRYATICSNAGFLGLPIIGGVYGAMGTLLVSVALIPQRIVMWSAGLSLFTQTDRKSVIRKLITHPCIVAVIIGFVLMVCGNPTLPSAVQKFLSGASGCTTCLSMLVIGSILAGAQRSALRDGMVWWFSFARLILIPLTVYAVLAFFSVDRTLSGVMVLMSGMPAGSTTAILAAKYDGDAAFASCLVFVSTLLSLITLPMLCLLL
ncbi:MAG: AEC family transporter [Clostridia bacterium]|nr:AEC family transporter [Clostridia bacterium]